MTLYRKSHIEPKASKLSENDEKTRALVIQQERLNASMFVVDALSEVRQACICQEMQDALTPKEQAAYAAALNFLEVFIDQGVCNS